MSSSEASSTPSRSPCPSSPASSSSTVGVKAGASSESPTKQQQEPGAPPVYLMNMSLNQDHSGLCLATTKDFRTFFLYSQAQSDNFVEFRRRLMAAPVAAAVMLYKTNIRAIVSAAEPTRVLLWDDKTGTAPHALCSRPEVLSVQMRRDVIAVIYVYSLPELDVMLHLDTHGNSRGVCTLNCDVHRETVMCCPDQQRGGIRVQFLGRPNGLTGASTGVSSHLSSHSILGAHNSAIMALQLNVSGTLVASAGESGTVIKVWASEDGQLLHELRRGTTNTLICCLSFRDDDQYLVSSSSSNTVHVFRLASARHRRSGSDSQGSQLPVTLGPTPPEGSPPPPRPRATSTTAASFSSTLLSYATSAVNYVEQQTTTLLQLGGGTPEQTQAAKQSLTNTLPIGYFKSARSIAQFHLPDIDPGTGKTSVDLRAVSGQGLTKANIGEGVPVSGPLVCFSKTHPSRIYVFHYNGLRYECEFDDDGGVETALASGSGEVPASTAMRLIQAITFFASRPDFHMENAAAKSDPPSNRSRHDPVAEYTVKKPPPEAVGITQFVNPLSLGGELRVKASTPSTELSHTSISPSWIKDWEVREVGTDFSVARLADEPLLAWWAEVEKSISAEAKNELDIDSSEELSFPALEDSDKTKAVEDAHWGGFASRAADARELIKDSLGDAAIARLDAFLHKTASRSHEAGVVRAKLGEGIMSDEDAYRLRGAIVAATKHMLVNVPCKFEGRDHRVFYVAENRGFKKLLLQRMNLSDAQRLIGLITCGYGHREVEFTFRSSGHDIETKLASFSEEVAKYWRDLKFEIVSPDAIEGEGTPVRVSWSRVYSQRGLHGGKRWRCVLHKANLDTPRVLALLEKKLRLPRESIHYAGLKDKRGLTYQYVTIPATHSPEEIRSALKEACGDASRGWASLDNFQLHQSPEKKFKCGTLYGNCFRIRLRGIEPGSSSEVESLRDTGFINYFGLQRFGWDKGDGQSSHVRTGGAIITRDFRGAVRSYLRPLADDVSEDAEIRREWLETGDAQRATKALSKASTRDNRDITLYQTMLSELATCRDRGRRAMMLIPRTLWHLLAAAYVSCLWNRLASRRIREGGLRVVIGDLVKEPTSRELRLIRSEEAAERYTIHDVRLPQLGEQVEGECRILNAGLNVEELYALGRDAVAARIPKSVERFVQAHGSVGDIVSPT
ncbi:hypothetical protein FOL46_007601 [Perkinsus olseni]|uniref:TRUD domain-containing protein n=1 Tax=Perkinsus olseni TaxID=32597 RepID=A0A7J6LCL3_PEROL|nr:hypothetical protein FOL46_007601 [Perkinsus olseni]